MSNPKKGWLVVKDAWEKVVPAVACTVVAVTVMVFGGEAAGIGWLSSLSFVPVVGLLFYMERLIKFAA